MEGGMRLTPQQMTERAAEVRRKLLEAGATDHELKIAFVVWVREIDRVPDTTPEERLACIHAIACGFGYDVSLTERGALFTPIVKHRGDRMKGRKHSAETRAKISAASKARLADPTANPMYGRTGSKNPFFGHKHSPEVIERCRAGAIARRSMGQPSPMLGRTHSEAAREKIRVKLKGRTLSAEQRVKVSAGLVAAWARRRKPPID
jgi:hypothetical protein